MAKRTGGSIFPKYNEKVITCNTKNYLPTGGMNMRCFFAGQALAGMDQTAYYGSDDWKERMAADAWAIADVMVAMMEGSEE